MHLQRTSSGTSVSFHRSAALTCGGEGCIYPVPQDSSLLAKIYHEPNQERARKLASMVAYPLDDPMAAQGHVSIAWPIDLLRDLDRRGQVVGFVMKRVNDVFPLVNFYNPSGRRQSCPLFNWHYLHQTARNLAVAFAAVHKRGDLVADVNSRNILASQRALITLVDTDSFQVRDPDTGHVYRCPVGTAEYTPPELQNCDLASVDRSTQHDCFGLAIILFQLLMEGTHPFAGSFLGAGDAPPYEERIRLGHFPYSGKNNVPYRPMPISPPLGILYPRLQYLFVRCFEEGHRNPSARPDAQTWQDALEEAEASLITCTANAQHCYDKNQPRCPWCERSKLLGGRDPFPSVQAVQKGQHLRPVGPPPRPQVRNNFHQVLISRLGSHAAARILVIQMQRPVRSPQPVLPAQLLQLVQSPAQRRQAFTKTLAIVVTIGFIVAAVFADDWRRSALFATAALIAGIGRSVLEKYPGLLAAAGIEYTGFTLLMIAGVIVPQLLESVQATTAFLFVIGAICLRAARWRLSFLLKYVVFAFFALITAFVISLDQAPASAKPKPPAKKLSVVDANTGESLRILAGNGNYAPAIAWSPDGKTIAAASFDNTVSLWNARSGNLQLKLYPTAPVYALAWSPDSVTLATGSSDGAIKLWNAESGRLRVALQQSGGVTALAWSPVGSNLASGNWDGTITLWYALGASHSILNNAGQVTSLAWSPDGKILASGTWDNTIRLWDTSGAQLRVQSESTSGSIVTVAWSPDGKTIASAGLDRKITVWNVFEERSIWVLRTLGGHSGAIRSVAWSPDGNMLASGSDDGTARLWDPFHGTELRMVRDPAHNVQAVAWSPDSKTLAIENVETITLWDVSQVK